MMNPFAGLRESVDEFAKGKSWGWHVLPWLFGLYIFVQMFHFDMVGGHMPLVLLVPYSFDFVLHEFAHMFTAFMPDLLTASAGSIAELLLGAGLVWGAFHFRNYFASLFCLLWFDLTLQSAGTYMADAVPQQLPLVSLGGALSGQDPVHDWHFVFGQLHMLGASGFIGNGLRILGHTVGLLGIAFTAYVMYRMVAVSAAEKPVAAPKVLRSFGLPQAGVSKPASPPSDNKTATQTGGRPPGSSLYPTPSRGNLADYPQHKEGGSD